MLKLKNVKLLKNKVSMIWKDKITVSMFHTYVLSLKLDSDFPKKFCFICFIESSFKMMKNAFYLILKALLVLKILKFLSWLFGHVEKTVWLEG